MPITSFTNNQDGLNNSDSPFKIADSQATGQSYNYDYAVTGAITKVLGPSAINTVPDTQLKSIGLGVHHSATTDTRSVVRAAGTKLQYFDTSLGTFTNLSEDTTVSNSDFLTSGSTKPVVFTPFNTLIGGTVLWAGGGDAAALYGYTGTNITKNGTPAPTGSISTTVTTSGGSFVAIGTYFYSVAFRKTATQALSNAALDVSATISNTTDKVSIDLSALTNSDLSKYDKIYIYRSAVSGVTAFTTGDLVAQVNIGTTSYLDTGTYITTASNIPRAGSTVLDNSVLPSGTINFVTAFKRRLLVAINGTFYVSDLDKPESWPIGNVFTPSTGGPITALGIIGAPSEYTTGIDQYACIWKDDELWSFTGNNLTDWELLFIDKTGCSVQSLVVAFNGLITWVTTNGIYIWDGKGKPSRISRPIQAMFNSDGDLDKTKLNQGYGVHFRGTNQVIWRLSHKIKGVQKLSIKMDTRLSATKLFAKSSDLQNPELDGVFITDCDSNAFYALCSYKSSPGADEQLLLGDNAGYIYNGFRSAGTAVQFTYETRSLDMGLPESNKRFKRVIAFIEKLTNNDLTLSYWADNRQRDEYKSKVKVSMSPIKGTQPALWDVALWDQAYWDDYQSDISPVEFNLHSYENNAEGTSLKLRFEQLEANAPVRIYSFAVEWEDLGTLSVPAQQI